MRGRPGRDEHPYRAIIDTAESKGCDLIVMASHGRHGISAIVLGRTQQCEGLIYCKIPMPGPSLSCEQLLDAGISTPQSQYATPASDMMAPSSRGDFRWDKRRGVYVCPNNKTLHTTGTVHDRKATPLSGFEVRLRCLLAQDAVLSQHSGTANSS